jgi:hypothetical protein
VRDATIFLQLIETTLGVLPGTVSRAG